MDRILQASIAAYTNAHSSTSVQLSTRQALLPPQSLRNRSSETFMLNANANDIMNDLDERVRRLGGTPQPGDAKSCVKAQQPPEQDGDNDSAGRLVALLREKTQADMREWAALWLAPLDDTPMTG